jgi:uracil-DNA glycosylase
MIACPPQLEASWSKVLEEEFQKPYMENLKAFVAKERAGLIPIFPPAKDVFNAFLYTPFDTVKVVIVGQDPYHGLGQAHGLCFSVQEDVAVPPSLQNIYKELHRDLDIKIPSHGCLTAWARQGVLLLNATLTVSQASPMSHHKKGWEEFTDAVIKILGERHKPIVFLLWGRSAQQKCQHLLNAQNRNHLVLTAAHPSPFSAHQGFFGCSHFSKTNEFLLKHGLEPINWSL